MDLDAAYEVMAAAITQSAREQSPAHAFAKARELGLTEEPHSPTATRVVFERKEAGRSLWFQYRYYDRSQAFSIQKDRNLLTIRLVEDGKPAKQHETEYDD